MHRLRTLGILAALAVFIAACGGPTPPAETHDLNVVVAGNGNVTFDTADGADAAGTSTHADGSQVTLVATAAAGNEFVGWSGDCTGTAETCVLTMDADKSVTATFQETVVVPETVQVTVALGGIAGGTVTQAELGIDCSWDGATQSGDCGPVEASSETEYTFTATPADGMVLLGWGGGAAACGTELTCAVTPNADPFNVTATFHDPAVPTEFNGAVAVSAGTDDGLEWVTAANTGDPEHAPGYTHSSLEYSGMAYVNRYAAEVINGFAFRDLGIPAGATITNAYIQFTTIIRTGNAAHVPSDGSADIALSITAEASTNPAPIPNETNTAPLSTRPTVGVDATWVPGAWATKGVSGEAQRTSDLTAVLQALVDQDGWSTDSDAMFLVSNDDADATVGWRQIATFNEGAEFAPTLVFEYTFP